jgi:tetratricopeptide (TPR) repeat protein
VQGEFDVGESAAIEIVRHWDPTAVTWPAFVALANAAVTLFYASRLPEARQAHEQLRRSPIADGDDRAVARLELVNAMACVVADDLEGQLAANERAARAFERAGDERAASGEWIGAADVCQQLGLWERAESIVRGVLATAERVGMPGRIILANACLGELALRRGGVEEARSRFEGALEVRGHENRRLVSWLHAWLANVYLRQGHIDEAEREVDAALATGEGLVHLVAHAEATRARIQLVRGNGTAALELARRALVRVRTASHLDAEGAEAHVELAAAEVAWAQGQHDEARGIVTAARDRLQQRASRLRDPSLRAAFLEQVGEHAALMERARRWCDAG